MKSNPSYGTLALAIAFLILAAVGAAFLIGTFLSASGVC
jgi:NADH:ubiquinone oxidoreductase subunit 6 (subunit J)